MRVNPAPRMHRSLDAAVAREKPMFSMLLPLDASEGRRVERPTVPPADSHTKLLERWLRLIRVALGLNHA